MLERWYHCLSDAMEHAPMKPPRDPKNDDASLEEESDLSPEDQAKQDKKDYDEHVKRQVGNYL